MSTAKNNFPLQIQVSFKKVFEQYAGRLSSDNELVKSRAAVISEIAKKYPELTTGITDEVKLKKYKPQIDLILEDMFSSILEHNEIKVATTPYSKTIFKTSERFQNIIKEAGDDFQVSINDYDEDEFYYLGCMIIMRSYYNKEVDFRRPLYFEIPDKNGVIHHYRIMYNADFIDITKTESAPDFTEEDFELLLDNFDNIALWKEKFPPQSYIFSGFVVANMFDVTQDVTIAKFKSNLLNHDGKSKVMDDNFERIFRSLFSCPDLKIGFSDFNEQENKLERVYYNDIPSYILNKENATDANKALCQASFYTLFKKNEYYTISNIPKFHKLYPENILYKKLYKQHFESAILAPIVDDGKLLGIFELVSNTKNKLNSINANKLKDIMPYLDEYVVQSKKRLEDELELIIQDECTSIHSSVHWKFKAEARRYLTALSKGNQALFREAVFEDVYPLFGQIDIKGSSEARNTAVQKDLLLQLDYVQKIIKKIYAIDKLPVYEQLIYNIDDFIKEISENFQVDSERQVLSFLKREIIPLFKHLSKKNVALEELINEYDILIDSATGFVYKHRRDYDDSVMQINKRMASVLDRKQKEAQLMYPHYFERFKTDGVEHNMYIGESITKKETFHKIYLYNLRLWQLQVMCEMENSYYKLKEQIAMPLDVASMILVFNSPLSLRFRMDEKRFDVDGTYNARYEVIKKRVDKANIKGTEERITQAGKITIVYSQKEDEREYLKYIKFLQKKKHLHQQIEIFELEDLQGVTGLKAIRVPVLYSRGKEQAKEYYTYDDLMAQINS